MADDFALPAVKAAPSGGGFGPSPARAGGTPEEKTGSDPARKADSLELSPEARKRIAELQRIDLEVRAHEAAHMAAGGGLVRGGASFSFTRGPDGRAYAVAGEVSLDASVVPDDPAATILKAQRLKAAALAPATPSPQDRKVAAAAGAMASQAGAELARKASAAAKPGGTRMNVLA